MKRTETKKKQNRNVMEEINDDEMIHSSIHPSNVSILFVHINVFVDDVMMAFLFH